MKQSLLTSFVLAVLGFATVIWVNGVVVGSNNTLSERLVRPLTDLLIVHPGLFIFLDVLLAATVILVPGLLWLIEDFVNLDRLLLLLSFQSIGFIMTLVVLHDTEYQWTAPLFVALHGLRILVLGLSRFYLLGPEDPPKRYTKSHYITASILNLNIFWAFTTLLLGLAIVVLEISTDRTDPAVHATILRWVAVIGLVAFFAFSFIAILADVHALWVIVAVDAIILGFNQWPNAVSVALILLFFIGNLVVLLYAFIGVVLSVFRTRNLVPDWYMRDGFDLRRLLTIVAPSEDAEAQQPAEKEQVFAVESSRRTNSGRGVRPESIATALASMTTIREKTT